jgi:hypothetical protein
MMVVLESPYAGDVDENKAYAALMTLALAGCGLAAYASHLHLTSFLDDRIPAHRALGIEVGLGIAEAASAVYFGTDLGWSSGMRAAYDVHRRRTRPIPGYTAQLPHVKSASWVETLEQWNAYLAHCEHPDRVLRQLGLVLDVKPCW